MSYIIVFKQHGGLNCEQRFFGPFADYLDAEDALGDGRVPLLYGQGDCQWPDDLTGDDVRERSGHRYITELEAPTRRMVDVYLVEAE